MTKEQIEELKSQADNINYDVAREREKQVRHDVMSHVYAYGVQCPKAKGIIHLGATSCYVGDNTDLIIMHEALRFVQTKIVNILAELKTFALKYSFDEQKLKEYVEKECTQFDVKAKNSKLSLKNGRFVASKERTGRELQVDQTIDRIRKTLQELAYALGIIITYFIKKIPYFNKLI